jgi:hypothetical protein
VFTAVIVLVAIYTTVFSAAAAAAAAADAYVEAAADAADAATASSVYIAPLFRFLPKFSYLMTLCSLLIHVVWRYCP